MVFGYTYSTQQLDNENRLLRETINRMQDEINKFKQPALMVCEVVDLIDDKAVVRTPNGNRFFVNIANECGKIKIGDTALSEQKNLTILRRIRTSKRFNVESFVIVEKPDIGWENIGGLREQVEEINREGVRLARESAQGRAYVGGSVGPSGEPPALVGKRV